MNEANGIFTVEISKTDGTCPVGEKVGSGNLEEAKIPVLSCEGACIRGEIARLAAHLVAKEEPYRRGCHGELFTVPGSAIAQRGKDCAHRRLFPSMPWQGSGKSGWEGQAGSVRCTFVLHEIYRAF